MDLLLKNGNIITLDRARPLASELSVTQGVISGVGRPGECESARDRHTEVIDLENRTLLPGFIDAHIHLRALSESQSNLDLSPAGSDYSITVIQQKIKRFAAGLHTGQWVRCAGYDETRLLEQRDLNRRDLDPVTPDNPVKITHRSGHAHVLNSKALEMAGINRWTADPPGGIIERDFASGEPNGQFYGAGEFLSARIPEMDEAQLQEGFQSMNHQLLASGITSVQDASHRNDLGRWRFIEQVLKKELLQCRVGMMLGLSGFSEDQQKSFQTDLDPNQLKTLGVKIILDETSGNIYPSPDDLKKSVLSIHRSGGQVVMHAIEESAIESACAAVQHAQSLFPRNDHRHRIEHCSVCPPDLVKKIAGLGIVVVTNPSFIHASGDRYLRTVEAEQLPYLYPISSLAGGGISTAFGSDAPIADHNPMTGIYAAVTRCSKQGRDVVKNEAINRLDALLSSSFYPAYAAFEENSKGSITVGKLADFIVLDGDPLTVLEERIKSIAVERTFIGGQEVTA